MKTFLCNNCGASVRRPTAPLRCEACGAQRIGLFKEAPATPSGPAAAPPVPATPAAATPSSSIPLPPLPDATPGIPLPPVMPAVPPQPVAPATPPAPAAPPSPPPAELQPVEQAPPPRPEPPKSKPQAAPRPEPKPQAPPPAEPKPQPKPAPIKTADVGPAAMPPGTPVWVYPPQGERSQHARLALRNCIISDGRGRMYAAIGKDLVALAETAGDIQIIWTYRTEGMIPGSPALGSDGRVRVHSGDGRLHCVNDTGEPAWSPVSVGPPLDWASPLVDEDANTWICSYAGGLVRIDPSGNRGGGPFFSSRQKFDSTGLICQGVFYVGAEDAFVYAIDMNRDRGRNLWNPIAGMGKTDWFINSAIALSKEANLIVAGRDEYLYCFGRDSKRLWKLHIRGQMLASPVVAPSGDIYVGVSLVKQNKKAEGRLVCINGETHHIRWEYAALGMVESTPVIGEEGVIYFGDNAGTIHAVDPDGKRVWALNVKTPVRSAGNIPVPHRVVFGTDSGRLVGVACACKSIASKGWPRYGGRG